ncbi:hypothetical protein GCM10012275_54370 [Longimycelium tulufanense]|uniref:Uncharacterized protein n=1 Tax=Longimycelium tulufanense TaxID=907463 RepID=A0A8J3CJA7_9PSEU|nr:hypothetical protein GCM10012275_54370 [Longimycelium tulufanense]
MRHALNGAQFGRVASFYDVQFGGEAQFAAARFGGNTRFDCAHFDKDVWFNRVRFGGDVMLEETTFIGVVGFARAQFSRSVYFGVWTRVVMDDARVCLDVDEVERTWPQGWSVEEPCRLDDGRLDDQSGIWGRLVRTPDESEASLENVPEPE